MPKPLLLAQLWNKKILNGAVFIYLESNRNADVFCWVTRSPSWGRIWFLVRVGVSGASCAPE